MVKIRLARHGAKKRPYYHVVVADADAPRDGRFLEQVGTYDPSRPDDEIRLNLDRVGYWLSVGAQMTVRARKVVNTVRRRPAVEDEPEAKPVVAAKPDEAKPDEAKPDEAKPDDGASAESTPAENGA